MTVGDRIRILRKYLNLTQLEFGKRLGYETAGGISKIEVGDNNVSEQVILSIAREYSVSYEWLTEGYEPMFVPRESTDMAALERIMTGDNEYVKRVFRELAAMPPEWWAQAVEMLRKISNDSQKDR